MKRILKHGKEYAPTYVEYVFVCECGCEFVANTPELTVAERSPNGNVYTICPECGKEVKTSRTNTTAKIDTYKHE